MNRINALMKARPILPLSDRQDRQRTEKVACHPRRVKSRRSTRRFSPVDGDRGDLPSSTHVVHREILRNIAASSRYSYPIERRDGSDAACSPDQCAIHVRLYVDQRSGREKERGFGTRPGQSRAEFPRARTAIAFRDQSLVRDPFAVSGTSRASLSLSVLQPRVDGLARTSSRAISVRSISRRFCISGSSAGAGSPTREFIIQTTIMFGQSARICPLRGSCLRLIASERDDGYR